MLIISLFVLSLSMERSLVSISSLSLYSNCLFHKGVSKLSFYDGVHKGDDFSILDCAWPPPETEVSVLDCVLSPPETEVLQGSTRLRISGREYSLWSEKVSKYDPYGKIDLKE